MRKIIIIFEVLMIVGVSFYLLQDQIDFSFDDYSNMNYNLYEGMYEYIEYDDDDGMNMYWIDLREDGTWKDQNSRMGFYVVKNSIITFYQNFLGVVTLHDSGTIGNQSIIFDEVVYILPEPYEAPQHINSIGHYIYWSSVPNANEYEIFVNDESYMVVETLRYYINYISSDFMNVKVRAIDTNNREKDGSFSEIVTLIPSLTSPSQSMALNLSDIGPNDTVVVPNNILKVEIYGDDGYTYSNISISISERSADLYLILNDVSINNSLNDSNKPIINYTGTSSFLTVIVSNGSVNRLIGQRGYHGADGSTGNDGSSGGTGYLAVNLKDVFITGETTLYVTGGNGGVGGDGGGGTLFVSAGDGGRGGDGRVPIQASIVYYDITDRFVFSYGSPGAGGDGGSGSLFGSSGSDGSSGSTYGELPTLVDVLTLSFD